MRTEPRHDRMTALGRMRGVARPSDPVGALLVRVAREDVDAFDQLYTELAGAVLGLSIRVLHHREIAEEVTQDVLVEVWRTAPRYRPERGSGRSWIMTIAHRRAVDQVRREQVIADRERAFAALDVARPHDEVVEAVEDYAERDRVRRGLGALTNLQRESLCLAYYGGYTQAEVGRLLGVPLGTVKTRLRDATLRLREALSNDATLEAKEG